MATPIPSNRALLEAWSAAEATGGRVVGTPAGFVARGITTDSRSAAPGCAFVALRGAHGDGHGYVESAIAAGAVLVVVERDRGFGPSLGADVVEVDDTLAAWGAIARAHLRRWRQGAAGGPGSTRTVAITGSAGKTTTKEMCTELLRSTGAGCHASVGNLNNRIGLPAVALEVEASHRFAVFEMGMSQPGEIAALAAIAEPDVGVITNVGMAHAGGVGGTVHEVAREKGALYEALRDGRIAVVNADDAAVVHQLRRAGSARVVTFGTGERVDYRLVSREPGGASGSRVVVRRPSGVSTFALTTPGAAAAIDFVAALAAAEAAVGAPLDDRRAAAALASLAPLPGRMQIRRLHGGVLLIDDTYNASPPSVRAALASLAEISTQTGATRRVAVLGEMKELGASAAKEHEALGAVVSDFGVALLVTCGGLADSIGRAAERLGIAVLAASDVDEAGRIAAERVRAGDAVLVKASRGVRAERVVAEIVRAHDGAATA